MERVLWLSDSALIPTGFSNQTRNILSRLGKNYDCWQACHALHGQPLSKPIKFLESDEIINFNLLPSGKQAYCRDIIQRYLDEYQPDVFGTLLDSLTGDRPVVVRNEKLETEILTFEDLYKRMSDGDSFHILSPKYKIGKERTWKTKLKEKQYKHKTRKKEVVGIWTKINHIAKRKVKDYKIYRINHKYGETEVSAKHSMICIDNDKLKKIKPEDMLKQNKELVKIQRLEFDRTSKRKLEGKYYEDFCIFFGSYVSEGCLNKYKSKYSIIISNNDKNWLEKIRKAGENILDCKGSYSKSNGTHNLVFYNKEKFKWIEQLAGKRSKNKKIPSLIFDLKRDYQLKFLYTAIEGDGHFYKKTNKQKDYRRHKAFSYTSNSRLLISGFSYLMTRLRINHSIYYREEKDCYSVFTNSYRKKKGQTKFSSYNYNGHIYDVTTENNMFTDGLGLIGTHNTFMVFPWFMNLSLRCPSFFYYPSDGEYFPKGCEAILKKVTLPIAMSKHGQAQTKKLFNINADYIPHGVDSNLFRPLLNKAEARARFQIPPNVFVVGANFRNQGRKFPARMIKVLAEFFKDKNDAIALFNTDPFDVAAPADLLNLIKRYKLEHKVRFTGMSCFKGLTTEDVVKFYNATDVHFLTTSGEGFGIPTIEAHACEVPSVITDYTTTKELVTDHNAGLPIKLNTEITGTWDVERGLCDIKDAVEQLNYMYYNRDERIKMGKNGRKSVLKYYTWDKVLPQWEKTIKKLLES